MIKSILAASVLSLGVATIVPIAGSIVAA